MSAEERCYVTFENVSRSYHQVINRSYDIRRYDFDSMAWMEFKGGDVGQCDVLGKGWLSIFSYLPESDSSVGTLTIDIGTEEKRCKTFNLRGHLVSSKGFTSIAQTEDGREKICTLSFEPTKISGTFIQIYKISSVANDNEIRLCREEGQKQDRKEEKRRNHQKDKSKKEKRSREDHLSTYSYLNVNVI